MGTRHITIEDMSDAFAIVIDEERYYFDQEDTKEKLVEVFEHLCPDDIIKYEEVY